MEIRPRPLGYAAVIVMMTASSAVAISIERPEDFVRRVYAQYRDDGPSVSRTRPEGAAFYAASVLDAFDKDAASAGETIDWDPICDCQAVHNLRIKTITIADRDGDVARARVTFVNLDAHRTVTLTLSRTPAGWRIADVGEDTVPSIMTLLRAANANPAPSQNPKTAPKP